MADFFEAEQQIMVNIVHGHTTALLPEDLIEGAHRDIVEASIDLRGKGVTPDVTTLQHWLDNNIGEENFGDFKYLRELRDMYPNVKRQEIYESIVKEKARRQRVIALAKGILHEEGAGAPTDDLIVMAQTEPMKLVSGDSSKDTALAQDVAFDVLEQVRDRRGGNRVTGVDTPIKKLSNMLCGFQKQELIILAGRPSMGKTALGSQIATHAAEVVGPVFVGSLEMGKSSLVERMLVGSARVDATKVRSGYITDTEYENLQMAAERMQDYHPIVINDSPRLTAQEVRMAISQAHLKYNGLSIAVIDYLGLLREDDSKPTQQRYREVGEATRLMRATAKELSIPVVLLCQLNRGCEYRENKRPTLADLRESGDIEQDSDTIIMLFRDEYYCNECNSPGDPCTKDHAGVAEAIVRKQRQGPTGTVMMTWIPEYTQFYNFERESGYEA